MPQKLWAAGAWPLAPLGNLHRSPDPLAGEEGVAALSPRTPPPALGPADFGFENDPPLFFD